MFCLSHLYVCQTCAIPRNTLHINGLPLYGQSCVVKKLYTIVKLRFIFKVFKINFNPSKIIKKKVYSVPAIRMSEPVFQTKVPASSDMSQDSLEARKDFLLQ